MLYIQRMHCLTDGERRFAQALNRVSYANPFSKERYQWEAELLQDEGLATDPSAEDPWQLGPETQSEHISPLLCRACEILEGTRLHLENLVDADLKCMAHLVRFCSYYEVQSQLHQTLLAGGRLKQRRVDEFDEFQRRLRHWMPNPQMRADLLGDDAHLFAIAFQLVRAFQSLKTSILGASRPSMELRASVWNSIFTADRRRYERCLFDVMHETSTLVIGASGTGKELVARAIGGSRYIAFDRDSRSFVEEIEGSFLPLNLAALSMPLIESELFGHKRGAFSGAVADREGFLESCPAHGTLFLDEIGELQVELQVKLLRTLQTRAFQRVGENTPRSFRGKLVSATNRDLHRARQEGLMRDDFYYRICSDVVLTPSLRAQLSDREEDLRLLVTNIAGHVLPSDEVAPFVDEVLSFVERSGLSDYTWPGNVRELEQCVRAILVRGDYQRQTGSSPRAGGAGAHADLLDVLSRSKLEAEDLVDVYTEAVFQKSGNYSAAARHLGMDRRTVKARLERLEGDDERLGL